MAAFPTASTALGAGLHPEVAKHIVAARVEARRRGLPDPFPRAALETLGAKRRRVVELAEWFEAVSLERLAGLEQGAVLPRPLEYVQLRAELVRVDRRFEQLKMTAAYNLISDSACNTAARWAREAHALGAHLAVSDIAAAKAFRDDAREPGRSKRQRDRSAKR